MALIRRARPADAAGIGAVHVASWRTTYPGLLPDRYLLSLSARQEADRWRRILVHRGFGDAFVALGPPHGIVGFGTCGGQRPGIEGFEGEFYTLYLLDHAQGAGLGRRLMAVMAAAMMERGMRDAMVWVLDGNPARWFYERLGGVKLAERRQSFAGMPVTEVAYGWRDLAPLARLSVDLP